MTLIPHFRHLANSASKVPACRKSRPRPGPGARPRGLTGTGGPSPRALRVTRRPGRDSPHSEGTLAAGGRTDCEGGSAPPGLRGRPVGRPAGGLVPPRPAAGAGRRAAGPATDPGPCLPGITSNTRVRSSQSSPGPDGGASDGSGYGLRQGKRSCSPGPPVNDSVVPRPGHSESSFRTDPSVCPTMLRRRYR